MPTVAFATHCHPPHLERLHKPGVLLDIVDSHKYNFDEILVVHQRCRGIPYRPIAEVRHRIIESEDYAGIDGDYAPILNLYGIEAKDPIADKWTHGPGGAHYWRWHCINHLIHLNETKCDFIVFSDCDSKIIKSPDKSWVTRGLEILTADKSVFCVSPSDGGGERKTQNMSQQLFLVETRRMLVGPLNLVWDGVFEEGGPMAEYQFMLEGRIGRLLKTYGFYRYVLPGEYRYWHSNPWCP